ncbi:MAG TPA: VOC family protein [Clostridiaceae bacterium]|nr:VOC family protein [Clostridiaceae bacterium]
MIELKKTLRLGSVHLNTKDPERLRKFYEELGMRSERDGDVITLYGGDAALVVLHTVDVDRRHEVGLYHMAILLPSRKDLGNFLYHLAKKRIPITGASDHHVSEAVYLSDPEGNGIEVYQDRDPAKWLVEGVFTMTTEAMDVEGVLGARDEEDYKGMPVGTTMGHLHLHVLDIEASEDFYKETLGLESMISMGSATFTSRDGYHHHLGMNTWLRGDPKPMEDGYPGLRYYTVYLDESVFDEQFPDSAGKAYTDLRDPNNILLRTFRGLNVSEELAVISSS